MPKNSKVHKVFDAIKKRGYDAGAAARIAQAATGKSLATGRAPKKSGKNRSRKGY